MVVAVVNGYQISKKEFEIELNRVLDKSHLLQATKEAKNSAIDHLIDGLLLLKKAQEEIVTVDTEEIDNRFLDIMLKYRSEKEFKEMLFKQNLDIDQVRKKIKNDILIEKYYQKHFPPSTDISMKKLKEIYQENLESFQTQEVVQASHILIKGHDKESYQKIVNIREKIQTTEDFHSQAELCSECPSCCKHGDLGYFTRGKMVKEFEDTAFKLKKNEISGPVKTDFGYHLIMVTDKKKQSMASFEQVKDSLKNRLQQIDSELKLIRHLKELRSQASIEIYQDLL